MKRTILIKKLYDDEEMTAGDPSTEATSEPDVKFKSDEWKCEKCTLVNKLPDYRCQACGSMNDAAWKRYMKTPTTSSHFASSPYDKDFSRTTGASSSWTC